MSSDSKKRRSKKKDIRPKLRSFRLGDQMADLEAWQGELDEYTKVLLGRVMPPIDNGVMTLMEVASAYYARAQEMNMVGGVLSTAISCGALGMNANSVKFTHTKSKTSFFSFFERTSESWEIRLRR